MTKRIYVGNLSNNTTERELASLFEQVGRVVSARIMTDRETNRPKGFGFIEMDKFPRTGKVHTRERNEMLNR